MIKQLRIKDYRSLAAVEITFEPLTVLVGPNGSGKSNVVDALRFIYDALRLGLDSAVVRRQGMSAIRRWSAKGRPYNVEIEVKIETDEIHATYAFTLGSERRSEYQVSKEMCCARSKQQAQHVIFETDKGQWKQKPPDLAPPLQTDTLILPLLATAPLYKQVYEFLTSMSFYNIFPNALAEPQKPGNPYPLDEYGGNLASTLRGLLRDKSPLLPGLKKAFQDVLPDVVDFQVSQVGGYLATYLFHRMSDERAKFTLSQESDGTLRLLGILVALYQDPPRTLIALEEPELTIHPGVLSLLWEEIDKASERSQIILTTHSPDLLDMCRAEQIRVTEKIEGETYIDPIDDTQKAIIRDRLFAPGELLRAQGLHRQPTTVQPKMDIAE